MNRDKKIVQCYEDPQFQLQILSSWMQMVQLIEDTYKLDPKPPVKNIDIN